MFPGAPYGPILEPSDIEDYFQVMDFLIQRERPQTTLYSLYQINKGEALEKLGYYQEAIQCYYAALPNLRPHGTYWPKSKCHERIQYLESLIDIHPYDTGMLNEKGIENFEKGKYGEAMVYFDQALRVDPNDPVLWTNRGRACHSLGLYHEAIECYDHALNLDPNSGLTYELKTLALEANAKEGSN